MIDKAVGIRKRYSETDFKQWEVEQVFMGMVKDIGNLSKYLMVFSGYRDDINIDTKKALEHELSDILYSLLVIADKTGIDLEKSFYRTMNELEDRINNNRSK